MSTRNGIKRNWNLQTSIYLLNNLCADLRFFSYSQLAALKLRGITLQVDTASKTLTLMVSTDEDYCAILQHLMPNRRLYQLLSIHFSEVYVAFGVQGEPVDKAIVLRSMALSRHPTELRDVNELGTRLRRALNAALQGHIGVLRLRDEKEIKHLRKLWERGRIAQLLEDYHIVPFDDSSGELIKLWKPRRLASGEEVIVLID